jgi:hypothetical protein
MEDRQTQIARSYALKKKAAEFQISTNDDCVKFMLRQLGQPICLFAEDKAFRRERLKNEIMGYALREMQLPAFTKL